MGLRAKYLRWKEAGAEELPPGISRPFNFFCILCALDTEKWKSARKIALEAGVSYHHAIAYLTIACNYGIVERIGSRSRHLYRLKQPLKIEEIRPWIEWEEEESWEME